MSLVGKPENVRERSFIVDQNFDGWRLDHFLANRIPRLSRTRAAEIARHGDLEVQPARNVKASMRVRTGDVVILREHMPDEELQDAEVRILYADDALIVVSKPAGMLVHEAAGVRLNTLAAYLHRAGFEDAEPVHRIDRETSGIVVCAATSAFVAPLRAMFAAAHVEAGALPLHPASDVVPGPFHAPHAARASRFFRPEKTYRAIVDDPDGVWVPGATRTIDVPLGLSPEPPGIRMVKGDLSAVTHVLVLDRGDRFADLEVRIETGRQHQIRAHLAMCGTPVAGDKMYTYDDAFFMAICDDPHALIHKLPFRRHMLHAWRIAFPHPATGERAEFEATFPKDWPTHQF